MELYNLAKLARKTITFCLIIFVGIQLNGQACIEIPNGISTRTTTLGDGNCDYFVDLCIDVPNSPRPKRIEYAISYDADGDGSEETSQIFNFAPGGSIPSGTHCLSAFAPSEEFIVNNIACGSSFSVSVIGFTNASGGTGGDCTTILGFVNENGYSTTDPLPIELSFFDASINGKENEIIWVTELEENTEFHIIQKSQNPIEGFTELGRIIVEGDSYETRHYSMIDKSPTSTSYYRLVSVDYDGSSSYSSVIAVERPNEDFDIKALYPIPAHYDIQVQYTTSKTRSSTLMIHNISGMLQKSIVFQATEGTNIESIEVEDLLPGIYILSINNGHEIIQKKFTKQ